MEGNKNAMYAKAGKSNGWQVVSGESVIAVPESKEMPVNPVTVPMPTPMPSPMPMPMPMPTPIPAPPIVVAPKMEMPVPMNMPEPKMEMPAKGCQTLAMAYVEMQKWQELYEPDQGFARGTLFTGLDLPFVGEGACKHE